METIGGEQPQWAVLQHEYGVTLLRLGQKSAAMKAFDKAEAASADPAVARVRAGRALLVAGDTEGALAKARASMASPTGGSLARALLVQAHARGGPSRARGG